MIPMITKLSSIAYNQFYFIKPAHKYKFNNSSWTLTHSAEYQLDTESWITPGPPNGSICDAVIKDFRTILKHPDKQLLVPHNILGWI